MENGENNYIDHLSFSNPSNGKLGTEDGWLFHIDKFTLAKRSKYFYALFYGELGRRKNESLIPGINGKVLNNVLQYLYTDTIQITEDNICELILATDYLLLDDLLLQLQKLFTKNLTIVNSLSILEISLKINRTDFSRESFRFIQTHFEIIINSENSGIGVLPLDILKLLLGDKNLCIRNEVVAWLAIINWVEVDTVNRLQWVPDLLMYLAIEDVDENIADCILQHDIVNKNPFCHQIEDVKSHLQNADNRTVLRFYFEAYPRPMLPLFDHRQPTRLHYIAPHILLLDERMRFSTRIYLTYDENIDLWRQIVEVDSPGLFFAIDDFIYMLGQNKNMCYNVTRKEWKVMSDFNVPRSDYKVLELDGFLYILGGICEDTGLKTYEVEYYDRILDEWFITSPMNPVTSFEAVAYDHCIYVVGSELINYNGRYETVCQVYDSSTESWDTFSSIDDSIDLFPTARLNFAMTVYDNKIYVIGGYDENQEILKSVRVFDPMSEDWRDEADVPYAYYIPKAIVLNDNLIVFDNIADREECSPAVQWNSDKKCWEQFEKSSSLNELYGYGFFTIENSEVINIISKENKDPATQFEMSPFN